MRRVEASTSTIDHRRHRCCLGRVRKINSRVDSARYRAVPREADRRYSGTTLAVISALFSQSSEASSRAPSILLRAKSMSCRCIEAGHAREVEAYKSAIVARAGGGDQRGLLGLAASTSKSALDIQWRVNRAARQNQKKRKRKTFSFCRHVHAVHRAAALSSAGDVGT